MNGDDLSKVVMIWSCEEEDPSGHFLSMNVRKQAGHFAHNVQAPNETSTFSSASEEQLVMDRAQRLTSKLENSYSVLRTARWLTQIQFPIILIISLAIVGGFLTDPIGPTGQINLLSFPLLTLCIWNVAMYIWLGGRRLLENVLKDRRTGCTSEWWTKVGLWAAELKLRLFQRSNHEEKQWIAASLIRFFGLWSAKAGEAVRHQGKSVLHWGAAGLALGVVLGMYLRGFAFEYRASWASTFLEAEQVHKLLSMVLYPASVLLGVDFPSVQTIATLETSGTGNAALWIHLWAVTCLLVIVIPRIGLALVAQHKASEHLERVTLPLDEPYFHRILAPYRGKGVWVEVLPYQCPFDPSATERLEGFCLEMFGNGAYVQTRKPISYGETDFHLQVSVHVPLRVLIIFDMATTPEQEVHGVFLQHIQDQIESWAAGASLLVCIHEESYLRQTNQQRREERFQTWQRFVSGYSLEPLRFSTAARIDDMLEQATAKLWSSRSQEVP